MICSLCMSLLYYSTLLLISSHFYTTLLLISTTPCSHLLLSHLSLSSITPIYYSHPLLPSITPISPRPCRLMRIHNIRHACGGVAMFRFGSEFSLIWLEPLKPCFHHQDRPVNPCPRLRAVTDGRSPPVSPVTGWTPSTGRWMVESGGCGRRSARAGSGERRRGRRGRRGRMGGRGGTRSAE